MKPSPDLGMTEECGQIPICFIFIKKYNKWNNFFLLSSNYVLSQKLPDAILK